MPTIVDYSSLGKAITDFAHRQDIAAYQDYFIQGALEAIQNDVFDMDYGNGVRYQEAAYGPFAIAGGVTPVPPDFLSPKSFQVADGSGNLFPLTFKAATWLYDNYPLRQSQDIPAYIARDLIAPCTFTGSVSGTTLTVTGLSGSLSVGTILDDTSNILLPNTTITVLNDNGTAVINLSQTVSSESMTGGGNVFVFGPYPDSNYSVQGVYYQKSGLLSVLNDVNWMISNCPWMLHAACMVEVAKFLKDIDSVTSWNSAYQNRLKAVVDGDKAERWAASTLQVELG